MPIIKVINPISRSLGRTVSEAIVVVHLVWNISEDSTRLCFDR